MLSGTSIASVHLGKADYIETNDLLSGQQICAECIKLESAKRDMSSCYYLERVARLKA